MIQQFARRPAPHLYLSQRKNCCNMSAVIAIFIRLCKIVLLCHVIENFYFIADAIPANY